MTSTIYNARWGTKMPAPYDICTFVQTKGYYPAGVIWHCEKCHSSGGGHSESHCIACCRSFGGDTAFLAHQIYDATGDTICRDPSSLKTKTGRARFKLIQRKRASVWVLNTTQGRTGNAQATAKARSALMRHRLSYSAPVSGSKPRRRGVA